MLFMQKKLMIHDYAAFFQKQLSAIAYETKPNLCIDPFFYYIRRLYPTSLLPKSHAW